MKEERVLGVPLDKAGGTLGFDGGQCSVTVAADRIRATAAQEAEARAMLLVPGWRAELRVYVGGRRGTGSDVIVFHRSRSRVAAIRGLRKKVGYLRAALDGLPR